MQNFEPTGAAAAMPGSAVPQIKRRLVISACLLIPLFYLGLGAAFGLPLPPFLTGDNAMWCGIVQLVLTVPVCWLNRTYFINGCKSIRAPGPDTLVALSSGAALVYGIIAIFTQDAPQELFLPSAAAILIFAAACQLLEVRFKAQAMVPLHSRAEVGIVIDETQRRKGIGRQALSLLESHCFHYLGIHQLFAYVDTANKPCRKLFTTCGYQECALLKDWMHTGKGYRDVIMLQKINF